MTLMEMVAADPDEMDADEVLFRLALSDWPADDVAAYWQAGVRDPHAARDCRNERIWPSDVARWTAIGVDATQIVRHHRARLTVTATQALAAHGITDAVAQRRFARNDVPPVKIEGFLQADVDDPNLMAAAHAAGLDAYDTGRFVDAGFDLDDIPTMVWLHERGIDGHQAASFVAAGVVDPAEMARLTEIGLAGALYQGYIDTHLTDTDTMLRLSDTGVLPHDVARYQSVNIDDPTVMIRLYTAGVDGAAAIEYTQAAVTAPDDMARLRAAGVSGRGAGHYTQGGAASVDEMLALNAAGVDSLRFVRDAERRVARAAREAFLATHPTGTPQEP